jgi:hypothetical protein
MNYSSLPWTSLSGAVPADQEVKVALKADVADQDAANAKTDLANDLKAIDRTDHAARNDADIRQTMKQQYGESQNGSPYCCFV